MPPLGDSSLSSCDDVGDFSTLEQFVEQDLIEPFIRQIRFPRLKNLVDGTELVFDYPITALIGPNGTNKRSCSGVSTEVFFSGNGKRLASRTGLKERMSYSIPV